MREPRFEQILGVRFFNGSGTDATEYISRNGGYTVVPAAPALANIHRDQDYRRALEESDLSIADSGFMGFLWRIFRRGKVVRTSGLQYFPIILDKRELREPALRFLTGDQNPIPDLADHLYLGWLLRLVLQPNVFAKRFLRAFELPWLIWKYGENLPPMRGS